MTESDVRPDITIKILDIIQVRLPSRALPDCFDLAHADVGEASLGHLKGETIRIRQYCEAFRLGWGRSIGKHFAESGEEYHERTATWLFAPSHHTALAAVTSYTGLLSQPFAPVREGHNAEHGECYVKGAIREV